MTGMIVHGMDGMIVHVNKVSIHHIEKNEIIDWFRNKYTWDSSELGSQEKRILFKTLLKS